MSERLKCGCGEGYASEYDGVCRFCREKQFSRADCKKVSVRFSGQGMTVVQKQVLKGEVKRSEVYL